MSKLNNQTSYGGYGTSTTETTDTIQYSNPRINTGYSPDGLVELLGEDEIDWDGYDWDAHPWVQGSGVDTSNWAKWDDMSKKDRKDWVEARREEKWPGFGYGDLVLGVGKAAYDKWVEEQGTTAKNGVIDKDYYMQDPLYVVAFAEMGITDTEWELEDLKKATMMVVETYKAVVSGDYKIEEKEWDVDPPAPWKPEEFTQEEIDAVYTPTKLPFDLNDVDAAPDSVMPDRLKKLTDPKTGVLNSYQTTQMKSLNDEKIRMQTHLDQLKPEPTKDETNEIKKGLGIGHAWEVRGKDWENHITSHPYKKVGEALGLKKVSSKNDFDQIAHWSIQAGVANLDSKNDVSKVKDYIKKDTRKKEKKKLDKVATKIVQATVR